MKRSEKFRHLLTKAFKDAPFYKVSRTVRAGVKLRFGGWFDYIAVTNPILGLTTLSTNSSDPLRVVEQFATRTTQPTSFLDGWRAGGGMHAIAVFSKTRPGNNGMLWWQVTIFDLFEDGSVSYAFSYPPSSSSPSSDAKQSGGSEEDQEYSTPSVTPHPPSDERC